MVPRSYSIIGVFAASLLTSNTLAWAGDAGNSQIVFETIVQTVSSSPGKGDLNANLTIITAAAYSPGDTAIADVIHSTSFSRWTEVCGSPTGLKPQDAHALITRQAEETGQDVKLAVALALAESQLNQDQVSVKGAIGLMQLTPETAKRLGVDPCKPEENVRGGLAYLAQLKSQFGNPVFALAAYNAGPDRIDQYHGVPPFKETLDYVAKILTNYYAQDDGAKENTQIAVAGQQKSDPVKIVAAKNNTSISHTGPEWKSGFVMNLD